ncbi:hypothetical protein [Symbioplanes lichenis]|uniref:hypothetical protein n=1 Tax=Symbioplanes lichenis TaxID=1629072 RepID=UPI00273A0B98|nr:hypothetical protein [Actinoplanes lichenis]
MSPLERRYLAVVRLCYPADHWLGRGREVVGTYLDLAEPGRRWPSAADVADLAAGGVRAHLRSTGAAALLPGFRLAAALALLTATALAAAWSVIEVRPLPFLPGAGPFASLGIAAWLAWLVAALGYAVAGPWTRFAVGGALALTVAVLPVAALTGLPRPPVFVLVPQVALGVVALAGSGRAPATVRLLPAAAGTVTAIAAAWQLPGGDYYGPQPTQVLAIAGTALLLIAMALAVVHGRRGGWALLILATPLGMLSLHPLARATDGEPSWPNLGVIAVFVAVTGPALVPLALAVRRRS